MATRNIVPRATNEGSIGTSAKRWNSGHFDSINYGGVFADGIEITPNVDNTVDLGRSGQRYKAVYGITLSGTAVSAKYADLAERFTVKEGDCPVGTVLSICKDESADLQICNESCCESVVGVLSPRPAYLMNSELNGLPVGLVGKVPVRIIGPIEKGQVIVSAGEGCARAVENMNEKIDKFGLALESDSNPSEKLVDCVIK